MNHENEKKNLKLGVYKQSELNDVSIWYGQRCACVLDCMGKNEKNEVLQAGDAPKMKHFNPVFEQNSDFFVDADKAHVCNTRALF